MEDFISWMRRVKPASCSTGEVNPPKRPVKATSMPTVIWPRRISTQPNRSTSTLASWLVTGETAPRMPCSRPSRCSMRMVLA